MIKVQGPFKKLSRCPFESFRIEFWCQRFWKGIVLKQKKPEKLMKESTSMCIKF